MKFRYASDLHLEFYAQHNSELYIPTMIGDLETVLILAGDIISGDPEKYKGFWDELSDRFSSVVYVPGNHEFYGTVAPIHSQTLSEFFDDYENIYYAPVLTKFTLRDGVTILAGQMWPNLVDDISKKEAFLIQESISDFLKIQVIVPPGESRLIEAKDMTYWNMEFITGLENLMQTIEGKIVVVTHWAPHERCIAKQFKNSQINRYFWTPVPKHLLKRAHAWIHGHTHSAVNEFIHGTFVLNNPRGYPHEQRRTGYNDKAMLEVN